MRYTLINYKVNSKRSVLKHNAIDSVKDEDIIYTCEEKNKDEIFKILYLRYQEQLFNYMRKFLYHSSKEIVEELLSEVFIKLYLHLLNLKDIQSFKSWIYRVAHNNCINYIKSQKNTVKDPDTVFPWILDHRINLEEDLMKKEIQDLVLNEINQFKDNIREMLIFKFYHNMTFDEISNIMNVPKRTLKYRVRKALNKLQYKFKELGILKEDIM